MQLLGIVVSFLTATLFIVLAIVKRENQKLIRLFATFAIVFSITTYYLWTIDLFNAETTNKEQASDAFLSNFGVYPPSCIKEIKLKNFGLYDADAHWMAFTYDSIVFKDILIHDRPLDTAFINTLKYEEIRNHLAEGCTNCPDWLILPNLNTSKIYYKKNFLQHSESEYYLWVEMKEKIVYLEVTYHD